MPPTPVTPDPPRGRFTVLSNAEEKEEFICQTFLELDDLEQMLAKHNFEMWIPYSEASPGTIIRVRDTRSSYPRRRELPDNDDVQRYNSIPPTGAAFRSKLYTFEEIGQSMTIQEQVHCKARMASIGIRLSGLPMKVAALQHLFHITGHMKHRVRIKHFVEKFQVEPDSLTSDVVLSGQLFANFSDTTRAMRTILCSMDPADQEYCKSEISDLPVLGTHFEQLWRLERKAFRETPRPGTNTDRVVALVFAAGLDINFNFETNLTDCLKLLYNHYFGTVPGTEDPETEEV